MVKEQEAPRFWSHMELLRAFFSNYRVQDEKPNDSQLEYVESDWSPMIGYVLLLFYYMGAMLG